MLILFECSARALIFKLYNILIDIFIFIDNYIQHTQSEQELHNKTVCKRSTINQEMIYFTIYSPNGYDPL